MAKVKRAVQCPPPRADRERAGARPAGLVELRPLRADRATSSPARDAPLNPPVNGGRLPVSASLVSTTRFTKSTMRRIWSYGGESARICFVEQSIRTGGAVA